MAFLVGNVLAEGFRLVGHSSNDAVSLADLRPFVNRRGGLHW
jgi:hypothetical protein